MFQAIAGAWVWEILAPQYGLLRSMKCVKPPWVTEISLSIWRFPQWNTCRLYYINLSFRHNLGQARSWSFLAIGRFFFDDDYISISKSVDVVRLGNLGSFEGDCFRAYSYTLKYCSKTQNKEKPILRYLGPKVQDLLSIVNPISLTVQWETRWISQIFSQVVIGGSSFSHE